MHTIIGNTSDFKHRLGAFVFDPFSLLVHPDIFLAMIERLRDISALLLSDGSLGSATKL